MASFEHFINANLINHNVVKGVFLLTNLGQVVYSYGTLKQISQNEIGQFVHLFDTSLSSNPPVGSTNGSLLKDFSITPAVHGKSVNYKIYQRTYCSIYATATGHSGGMVVCNLPYGVLVCVYESTTSPGDAIKAIERFCDIMRR